MELKKELETAKNQQVQLEATVTQLSDLLTAKDKVDKQLNAQLIICSKHEDKLFVDIQKATDENGKPKYSNQKLRDVALNEAKSNDAELLKLEESKKALELELRDLNLKIDLIEKQRRTLFSTMRLQEAILNAVSSLQGN